MYPGHAISIFTFPFTFMSKDKGLLRNEAALVQCLERRRRQ